MHRAAAALLAFAALASGVAATQPAEWDWGLPEGVAPPPVPADNPMSAAKVELGRRLFYDADLSIDGTISCATCHSQRRAFADSTRTRPGVHGDPGKRNVQGLTNVAYLTPLTWADWRLAWLEDQVPVPVFGDNPVEMGMKGHEKELARRLSSNRCYRRMFRAAFPETRGRIDGDAVAKALAAFQRTMLSYGSPFDRHQRGEEGTRLPQQALAGKAAFTAHCASCHSGANFTDGRFHALAEPEARDRGLAEVTGVAADAGRFRTPGLRNVALTGPYMHDGSADTLAEAIARHGRAVPAVAHLAPAEHDALAAFLHSLTDEGLIRNPQFAHPEEACGKPL